MLTVIEPATETALTTLEAVLRDLGREAGSDLDPAIMAAIGQASAAICSWCGRTFALETVRETFHHTAPASVLLLSRSPLVELVSVTTEAGAVSPDSVEADTVGILHLLDGNGRCKPWPIGRVGLDYAAGYSLPGDPARTLPHDIERAAIVIARGIVQAVGRDGSVKSESVEGVGSWTYGLSGATGAVTGEVEDLLAPYRERGIG